MYLRSLVPLVLSTALWSQQQGLDPIRFRTVAEIPMAQPSVADWGPDGLLYVASLDGRITAMAFDAEIFGNWACKPEHYPAVADAAISGQLNLKDNVEQHPLETINEIIPRVINHEIQRRVVFTP